MPDATGSRRWLQDGRVRRPADFKVGGAFGLSAGTIPYFSIGIFMDRQLKSFLKYLVEAAFNGICHPTRHTIQLFIT